MVLKWILENNTNKCHKTAKLIQIIFLYLCTCIYRLNYLVIVNSSQMENYA